MAQNPNKRRGISPITPIEEADDCSSLELILKGVPEGRRRVIIYVRQLAFEDDRYKALIRDFDEDKKQDLGDLCRKHNIAPQDLMADVNRAAYPILEEAMAFARGIAQGIVAERLPKVVNRGMIEASKSDGIADRHFTLQKEGFHVAPKGTTINLTQNQLNQQAAGLPNFSDDVKDMAALLGEDEPLALEAGDETDYIDSEISEKVEELV